MLKVSAGCVIFAPYPVGYVGGAPPERGADVSVVPAAERADLVRVSQPRAPVPSGYVLCDKTHFNFPSEHEEELLPSEGDGALEQAAQGGCRVSFSGDIPDPPGQGPVQPALGDPAWAGGLD